MPQNILKFENQYVDSLPSDPIAKCYPRQVPNACFSFVTPAETPKPSLVCVSQAVAQNFSVSIEDQQAPWFINC